MSIDYPAPPAPSSGNATLALVLGIVGLLGGLGSCCCCLFAALGLCAPFGWYLGRRELAAIAAGQAPQSGQGMAQTGMICGIIGSALLALYVLVVIAYVALVGVGVAMETLKHGGVPTR